MSLFKGLYATPGQFYFKGRPSPSSCAASARTSIRRSAAPTRSPGGKGRTGDHGGRHREGPIGHWDQTTATFPFLQEIVDLIPFSRKPAGGLVHFGLSHQGAVGDTLLRRAGAHPSRLTSIGRIGKRQGAQVPTRRSEPFSPLASRFVTISYTLHSNGLGDRLSPPPKLTTGRWRSRILNVGIARFISGDITSAFRTPKIRVAIPASGGDRDHRKPLDKQETRSQAIIADLHGALNPKPHFAS